MSRALRQAGRQAGYRACRLPKCQSMRLVAFSNVERVTLWGIWTRYIGRDGLQIMMMSMHVCRVSLSTNGSVVPGHHVHIT